MPLDVCNCESNGCGRAGGIKSDPRTVIQHKRQDRLRNSLAGRVRALQAIDDEHERISSSFVSASAPPSNDSSLPADEDRDRARSQRPATADDTRRHLSDPDTRDSGDISSSPSDYESAQSTQEHVSQVSSDDEFESASSRRPSKRERERLALADLSALADEIKTFRKKLFYDLRPGQPVTLDILRLSRRTLRSLEKSLDKLASIRNNATTVVSLRNTLREELLDLRAVLKEMDSAPKPPVKAAQYDACKFDLS